MIINKMPRSFFRLNNSGIALVAVLAILVVLAIMAASFTALMNIENKQSQVQMNSQQLDMLIGSGLEQAKAIITVDDIMSFNDKSKINPLFVLPGSGDSYSKWIFVKDSEGKICGRYRFRIEDESSKVNINKAFLLKKGRGTG
ncbi:MAG: hypothetical protein DRI44_07620 [Chlamydiae bacterium]|nr:MAG: hypothetical protein DRI44_07620 [Chlamydiota bacterium]